MMIRAVVQTIVRALFWRASSYFRCRVERFGKMDDDAPAERRIMQTV